MRWDLIDRFETLRRGERAVAFKEFSGREDFFAEHFPGRPLFPEPLFIELVAQSGGVLYGLGIDFKKEVILAKIDTAEFFGPVAPPCRFRIEAVLDEEREEGAWISGAVEHEGRPVAKVRIFLAAVETLDPGNRSPIVFNEGFLKHYDVYHVARMSEA